MCVCVCVCAQQKSVNSHSVGISVTERNWYCESIIENYEEKQKSNPANSVLLISMAIEGPILKLLLSWSEEDPKSSLYLFDQSSYG